MGLVWIDRGDIFNSPCQTLVNPVNCVGVMGKGLALQFKERWPDVFRRYAKACVDQRLILGRPLLDKHKTPWVVHFPTKNHWNHPARLWAIEEGLVVLRRMVSDKDIRSIAMPALGCGNGGLTWRQVAPHLTAFAEDVEVPVFLHAPHRPPIPDDDGPLP